MAQTGGNGDEEVVGRVVSCGDYVKLEGGGVSDDDHVGTTSYCSDSSSSSCSFGDLRWWLKMTLLVLFCGLLGLVFLKWVGPFIMEEGVIPMINWIRETFDGKTLALLLFTSIAIFPSLLIPSSPSMWIAGMTFGYIYGFFLIYGAVIVGVSLPYFIGSLFHRKIQEWLDRYPKRASVIRLAGEGSFFNQFRAVALIRMSPFPYILYNYCAVATDVKYVPYLLGTLVGMVPEIILTLYTGIILKTLADVSQNRHRLSSPHIVSTVIAFCLAIIAGGIVTLYAKWRLKKLKIEEGEALLR